MPDTEALLTTLEWMTGTLTVSSRVSEGLHRLAEDLSVVLGISGAGIMLFLGGRYMYATSSHAPIAALERVVEAEQSGPCIEAANGRRPVVVRDICAGSFRARFPSYVAQAHRSGLRAVAALPMAAGGRTLGAVGLYQAAPHDWTGEDLRTAAILADIASGFVAQAAVLDEQRRLTVQLQHALDSRVVIEQAKGIVAVEGGMSIDQAFAVLRKQARDSNQRLRDICERIVSLHRG